MKGRLLSVQECFDHNPDQASLKVYNCLSALNISFLAYTHEASPTAAHVSALDQSIRGSHCKNLFLKNSKGDQLFLLIVPYHRRVDLRQIARRIGSTRLSFADAALMGELLGLAPGAVSPFGLINDAEHRLQVLLDEALCAYEYINFHPNLNTATISLAFEDFRKYLTWVGNRWQMISIDSE